MIFKLIEKLNKYEKFKYFYISPLVYSIGDSAEQIVIVSKKIQNKKIIILFPFFFKNFLNYKICNKYLFENLLINNFSNSKNFLNFLINNLFNLEFFLKRFYYIVTSKLFKFKIRNFEFPNIGIHKIYEDYFLKKDIDDIDDLDISKNNIFLSEENKKLCRAILYENNIPLKKIICLHVRDGGYKNDFNRKSYRNSNISNYNKLIDYLVEKNYFVIRMGDNSSAKSNYSHKLFFDYAHSNINSGLMDIFLISECSFFIGTQSGILDLAYMFSKPVLTTNMCELFSGFPRKINDRGLFKKITIKNTGQKLNLKEYMEMNYSKHNPEIDHKEFEFIENSPEELYDSVVEFENLFNSRKFDLSYEQIKINKQIKDTFKKNFYPDLIKTDNDFDRMENVKIALWVKSFKGSLCENYLNENVK